ncbi:unnamed protein product, partial [Phaeothamnion confervicola]
GGGSGVGVHTGSCGYDAGYGACGGAYSGAFCGGAFATDDDDADCTILGGCSGRSGEIGGSSAGSGGRSGRTIFGAIRPSGMRSITPESGRRESAGGGGGGSGGGSLFSEAAAAAIARGVVPPTVKVVTPTGDSVALRTTVLPVVPTADDGAAASAIAVSPAKFSRPVVMSSVPAPPSDRQMNNSPATAAAAGVGSAAFASGDDDVGGGYGERRRALTAESSATSPTTGMTEGKFERSRPSAAGDVGSHAPRLVVAAASVAFPAKPTSPAAAAAAAGATGGLSDAAGTGRVGTALKQEKEAAAVAAAGVEQAGIASPDVKIATPPRLASAVTAVPPVPVTPAADELRAIKDRLTVVAPQRPMVAALTAALPDGSGGGLRSATASGAVPVTPATPSLSAASTAPARESSAHGAADRLARFDDVNAATASSYEKAEAAADGSAPRRSLKRCSEHIHADLLASYGIMAKASRNAETAETVEDLGTGGADVHDRAGDASSEDVAGASSGAKHARSTSPVDQTTAVAAAAAAEAVAAEPSVAEVVAADFRGWSIPPTQGPAAAAKLAASRQRTVQQWRNAEDSATQVPLSPGAVGTYGGGYGGFGGYRGSFTSSEGGGDTGGGVSRGSNGISVRDLVPDLAPPPKRFKKRLSAQAMVRLPYSAPPPSFPPGSSTYSRSASGRGTYGGYGGYSGDDGGRGDVGVGYDGSRRGNRSGGKPQEASCALASSAAGWRYSSAVPAAVPAGPAAVSSVTMTTVTSANELTDEALDALLQEEGGLWDSYDGGPLIEESAVVIEAVGENTGDATGRAEYAAGRLGGHSSCDADSHSMGGHDGTNIGVVPRGADFVDDGGFEGGSI